MRCHHRTETNIFRKPKPKSNEVLALKKSLNRAPYLPSTEQLKLHPREKMSQKREREKRERKEREKREREKRERKEREREGEKKREKERVRKREGEKERDVKELMQLPELKRKCTKRKRTKAMILILILILMPILLLTRLCSALYKAFFKSPTDPIQFNLIQIKSSQVNP